MKSGLERPYNDPIFRALHPGGKRFLDARFLSPRLNPFSKHSIIVAALTLHGLPHMKTIPALQMMLEDFTNGRYEGKHTIVVDSSGNTAHAVARLASAFGFSDVKVVLSADVPSNKVELLAALSSVEIISVPKGRSVSERAREEGQRPGHYHLNQYSHEGNANAHRLYTGPEVWRTLNGKISVIAIAMGSSGTALGVGRFLRERDQGTVIVGVCPTLGEQVPGARDSKRMADVVTLPWRDVVDTVVEVPRNKSFVSMRSLWSEVEPQPGPTSGLAYAGLLQYLGGLNEEMLSVLRGGHAAFICPDSATLYSSVTIAELDTDQGVM